MSDAFAVQVPGTTSGAPTGDLKPPVVTASPAASTTTVARTKTVTLTADEPADIYYTTDGSAVLANGDLPSNTAKLYTGEIAVTSDMFVKFVAFDRAGNFSQGVGHYAPPVAADPVPNAPLTGNSTGGEGTLTLRWSASDPTITGFRVQLIDNLTGQPAGGLRETTATFLTINDLGAGSYSFTVQAKNASGYGDMSAAVRVDQGGPRHRQGHDRHGEVEEPATSGSPAPARRSTPP